MEYILRWRDSNSPSADLNESELFSFELLLLSEVSSELVTLAAVFLNLNLGSIQGNLLRGIDNCSVVVQVC